MMIETADLVGFLRTIELFSSFGEDKLGAIVDRAKIVTYQPNESIIEFGSEGRFFGVMIEGEAVVSVRSNSGEEREFHRLRKGDLFGEMALLTGQRTVADVISVRESTAVLFSQSLFASAIMPHPAAIQTLSRILTARSRDLAYDDERDHMRLAASKGKGDPMGLSLKSDTPHRVLVINCGSSSLKYRLYDTESPDTYFGGVVERIGEGNAHHRFAGQAISGDESLDAANHKAAFEWVIKTLLDKKQIHATTDISVVGHRVVHGGEKFTEVAVIDDEVISDIEKLSALAPLHNPVNVLGIRLAMALFPQAMHAAVFDTAFHHTMPSYAYLYGLPLSYREKGIRRFGFHGISHKYVALRAAHFLGRPFNGLETITCHLGNGASLCAVDHGRSIDTSMGMTPTAGIPMGTRCGDVDPGVLVHLMRTEGMNADEMDTLINRKSGLLGLSDLSNDLRILSDAAKDGNGPALVAIRTFCYQLRKNIGAYAAAMHGLDCLVFTGGIGEHSAWVRSLACQGLECMGISIDEEKNQAACGMDVPVDIGTETSRVRILVVPTDEERLIARESLKAAAHLRTHAQLASGAGNEIPIEVSAHHIHLCREHVDALFGKGHQLTPVQPLSQPGQFACKETVTLVGPRGNVERVRVLGPERAVSQVEIAMTEQFKLGIHPPIRESGDVADTPGVRLEGPEGAVDLNQGVICAQRHIHMTPEDALRFGLRDRYQVRVVVKGDRELIFGDVVVRVSPKYKLAMHIDTDEANAASLVTGAMGRIESIQSRGH